MRGFSTLSATIAAMMPLNEYLAQSSRALRLRQPGSSSVVVVLGNEAADPDSCVCSIGMARLLAHLATDGSGENAAVIVPVLPVPRADFALQASLALYYTTNSRSARSLLPHYYLTATSLLLALYYTTAASLHYYALLRPAGDARTLLAPCAHHVHAPLTLCHMHRGVLWSERAQSVHRACTHPIHAIFLLAPSSHHVRSPARTRFQLDRLHLLRRAGLRGTGEGVSWRPNDVLFADELDLAGLRAEGR